MLTKKGKSLLENTYSSLLERIGQQGYANTSINGAYGGMYCRDASIHVLCHLAYGDFAQARMLLQYTLGYHEQHQFGYVIHVLDPSHRNPCLKRQTDATYFFVYAWCRFAKEAPQTPENQRFLQESYETVKGFADYFLTPEYWNHQLNLLFNPSLEHSRDRSYFQCYDLLTNVYASQGLHELAEYAQEKDPEAARRWETFSQNLVKGIHTSLTAEVEGKRIYAELIGRSQKAVDADANTPHGFIRGFSWVNLAPIGCRWYAADQELLENTYQMHLKYGSCLYYGTHRMLDSFTPFETQMAPIEVGTHVLGKGLAWEMMYCKRMGYADRLEHITGFVEDYCDEMFRETWLYTGGGSDTANQEHASWMLLAYKECFLQ